MEEAGEASSDAAEDLPTEMVNGDGEKPISSPAYVCGPDISKQHVQHGP